MERGPLQLFLGAFVHHDAHVRVLLADVIVAADVIGVAVRVDDQLDRLVGDLLDLAEDRRAVARHLGVDQHDAVLLHDDQRIPAAAENLVDVVFDVLDRLRRRKRRTRRRRTGGTGRRSAGSRLGLLLRCSRCGQATGNQKCQNNLVFISRLPWGFDATPSLPLGVVTHDHLLAAIHAPDAFAARVLRANR